MPTPKKHHAFISYSRQDEAIAKRLEKFLEQYKIPKTFQALNQKSFSIFRDVHDIELGELSEKLKEGLDQSDFLIVLCSPSSYKSDYVGDEIRYFGEKNGKEKILPVLVGGRPNHEVKEDDPIQDFAFHEELFRFFDEPLAADIREIKGEGYFKTKTKVREARFQIISKLLYTDKTNELVGRYQLSKRIQLGVLTFIALATLSFFAWNYYDNIPKSGISFTAQSSTPETEKRVRQNLKILNKEIKNELPKKSNQNSLLIATWNVKNLGTISKTAAYNNRGDEPLAYIAEIISHFDVIAIQEVKENLSSLDQVMSYLGNHWEKKFTGVSEGKTGNKERLGFIFDSRKVQLGDLTDEIVLSEGITVNDSMSAQISRTPYLVEFIFKESTIQFCNVHIYYGNSHGPKLQRRLNEIDKTTEVLKGRIDRSSSSNHLVLLGDMNVVDFDHESMKIIQRNGFFVPDPSINMPTNFIRNKYYDQIVFATKEDNAELNILSGGSLDYYKHVYRPEDISIYEPIFIQRYKNGTIPDTDEKIARFYTRWKQRQMSDHLVKWIEVSLPED